MELNALRIPGHIDSEKLLTIHQITNYFLVRKLPPAVAGKSKYM